MRAKICVAILCLLFSLIGCGDDEETIRIGVSVIETTAPFYTLFRQGMMDTAAAENVKVIWHNIKEPPPNWWQRRWQTIRGRPPSVTPLSRETTFVREMLRQRVSLLVIQPVVPNKLDYIIRSTQRHRVPMITLERLPFNRRVAGHTQLNATMLGQMAARFAIEKIGRQGNLILVAGPTGNELLRQIVAGMYQVLDQYPQSVRVFERSVRKLSAEEGFVIVNDLLTQYAGNVQGIIACDSVLSEGVVRAVQAHGLYDKITTVGVGAGRQATEWLRLSPEQGSAPLHDMEVDLMPYEWGEKLMDALIQLVTNKELKVLPHDEIIPNGDVEVPVLYAPAREITRSNIHLMKRMWPDLFSE